LDTLSHLCPSLFFFNDAPTTEIYTLSLHDALPILPQTKGRKVKRYQPSPQITFMSQPYCSLDGWVSLYAISARSSHVSGPVEGSPASSKSRVQKKRTERSGMTGTP